MYIFLLNYYIVSKFEKRKKKKKKIMIQDLVKRRKMFNENLKED